MDSKPLSLLREDLTNNLVNTINNSRVPFILVELILENVLNQIKQINKRQLETDRADWLGQSHTLEDNDGN